MVLAYERRLGEQKLVVFCNMDGEQHSIKMADEWKNYKALLENYEWKKPALSGEIYSMEPYELLVLAKIHCMKALRSLMMVTLITLN